MKLIESKNKPQSCNTVLNEIKYLRGMHDFLIDRRNSNRYQVVVKEPLGHTAYCFSTPIYNTHTRRLVHMAFEKSKDGYSFKGSNGSISIHQNRCVFENKNGRVVVFLSETPTVQRDNHQLHPKITVTPTLNGIRFSVNENQLHLLLKSEVRQAGVRINSTCFSVMSEEFQPFLSVAALYSQDRNGNFFPVEMSCQDTGDQTYDISLFHENKNGRFLFEINLYEPKLFQDTTVESAHPDTNNAYGAIGFIGCTKQFGEQWLYSRPDFSKIPDLTSKSIEAVLLHIPVLNLSPESVDVFVPERRFCSFGSTWNQKVTPFAKRTSSINRGRYLTIDVTAVFTNHTDRTLVYNEGLILKKPKGKDNFIAISTGDCYSAPQILEIKFKK